MLRTTFLFLVGLIIIKTANAQKPDTILLYMTNNDEIVTNIDSADYYLQIIPGSKNTKNATPNKITEFYTNREPKLDGMANVYLYGKTIKLTFLGLREDFFTTGKIKTIANYENGRVYDEKLYYPNGQLYAIEDLSGSSVPLLIECHDTTGKVLAQKGNGKWIKFDNDFKSETQDGFVKDSVQEGEWREFVGDLAKYTIIYKHGIAVSSDDPNWSANTVFAAVEVEPHFKSGAAGFNAYLAKAVKYPTVDRDNGTQGKVIVTFVVEKNGTLSTVKALRGPDKSMMDAVVQAIEQSPPWVPGIQNGRPVRVQFTISFAFSVATQNF